MCGNKLVWGPLAGYGETKWGLTYLSMGCGVAKQGVARQRCGIFKEGCGITKHGWGEANQGFGVARQGCGKTVAYLSRGVA